MKIINIAIALVFVSFTTCQAQTKKSITANSGAYAEISVKEGGKWEGRKYVGGIYKNVQALKVAPEHTDHSFDIRYEGPGFENKHMAYRLYLDWRNAIDLFGKYSDTIVLPKVGIEGSQSYHEKCEWGSDILNSGKAMGIGSIGRYANKELLHFNEVDSSLVKVENEKTFSAVNVNYFGWKTANDKIDFKSKLTVVPEERFVKHTITPSKKIEGICTGIVKLNNLELITKTSTNKKWAYIATYGAQSIFSDNLGMAIFYETETVENSVEGVYDHLLIFKPTTNSVNYYLLAAWEKEKAGIKTKEEFLAYLDQKLAILNKKNKL
jgi:hypothetical protein